MNYMMYEVLKDFKKLSVRTGILICGFLFSALIITGCAGNAEADITEPVVEETKTNPAEDSVYPIGDVQTDAAETSVGEAQDGITESSADEKEKQESEDDSEIIGDLPEDVQRQLTAFANAKDIWDMEDYAPWSFSYAVFDLDMDGKLELITSATAGTGIYSENHFYQADDTGLSELPQEYYSDYAEFDILNNDNIAYRDGDIIYYPSVDVEKNGIYEIYISDGAYYVKNGVIYSHAYRSNYRMWQDDNVEETYYDTFYDTEGNEITQDAWELCFDAFFGGMDQIPYVISWKTIEAGELTQTSCQAILAELADSYREAQFDCEPIP